MNIEGSIARTTVSEAVFRRLRDQILTSAAVAGTALPSERTLSETFGVNRHAVREAIKRLQQAGLVTVAHGGATRVTNWRVECGPDLLVGLVGGLDAAGRAEHLEQLQATRRPVLETIVHAAAEVRALPSDFGTVYRSAGPDEQTDSYVALWNEIAYAGDNIAAQLTLNSLTAALDAIDGGDRGVLAREALQIDAVDALIAAIEAGDATEAQAALGRVVVPDRALA